MSPCAPAPPSGSAALASPAGSAAGSVACAPADGASLPLLAETAAANSSYSSSSPSGGGLPTVELELLARLGAASRSLGAALRFLRAGLPLAGLPLAGLPLAALAPAAPLRAPGFALAAALPLPRVALAPAASPACPPANSAKHTEKQCSTLQDLCLPVLAFQDRKCRGTRHSLQIVCDGSSHTLHLRVLQGGVWRGNQEGALVERRHVA